MTTIVAWMSCDQNKKKTFYLGADSLGTDVNNPSNTDNFVKKVYHSESTPEIFSYSGDVTWGQDFCRQIKNKIAENAFQAPVGTLERVQEFSQTAARPPTGAVIRELQVLYACRVDNGDKSKFALFRLDNSNNSKKGWAPLDLEIHKQPQDKSRFFCNLGAGSGPYNNKAYELTKNGPGLVSRSWFWALCDLLDGKPDPKAMTGGVPQIVKLDQGGPGVSVGVNFFKVNYIDGHRTNDAQRAAKEWIDETFTYLNPKTMEPWSKTKGYVRGPISPNS